MLFQCWCNVGDVGPTLKQHCIYSFRECCRYLKHIVHPCWLLRDVLRDHTVFFQWHSRRDMTHSCPILFLHGPLCEVRDIERSHLTKITSHKIWDAILSQTACSKIYIWCGEILTLRFTEIVFLLLVSSYFAWYSIILRNFTPIATMVTLTNCCPKRRLFNNYGRSLFVINMIRSY